MVWAFEVMQKKKNNENNNGEYNSIDVFRDVT